jgi:hypothetical protein
MAREDNESLHDRIAGLEREIAYLRGRLGRALQYLEGAIPNASLAEAHAFAVLIRKERPGLPTYA